MKLFSGKIKIFFVVVLAIFMGALASVSPSAAYAASSYDYTRKDDVLYRTLTAADVLDSYVGSISQTEKNYLQKYDSFTFSYSDTIPNSYVTEAFDGNSIWVTASDYTFTAVNGEQVRWQPSSAHIGDRKMEQNGEGWTAQVEPDDGDILTVEYTFSTSLAAADVNAFLNKTFDAAYAAHQKIEAENERYQQELDVYNADYQKYQKYLSDLVQYYIDLVKYQTYLTDYTAWQRDYDEYSQYMIEYEQYLKELDEYNNYDKVLQKYYQDLAAYQQYLLDYKDYQAAVENYNNSLSSPDVQTVTYHLSILDYLTRTVAKNRTLGGAILGNSVTKVLSQTEALVLAGAERAAVEKANDATIALRSLITAYSELSTNQEKYAFYVSCFDSLKNNFIVLLRTLDYFYDFAAIRSAIKQYNATENYEILVAQLYYMCNALDDGKIANYIQAYKYDKTGGGYFDSSYRIGPNKTLPSALVGAGNVLQDKNNGAPLAGGYVEIPVMPTEPQKVENPGGKPEQRVPIAPDVVANPGNEPAKVDEPTLPTKVGQPTLPTAYVPSDQEQELCLAYKNGHVSYRDELNSDYTLVLTAQVTKYFRNAKISTLRFYGDIAQTELLYTVDALIGSYVEYPHQLPTKTRTGYTCVFDYWQDEYGNKVDLGRLQTDKGDLNLYPHFDQTPNLYVVYWYVNGTRLNDECAFDSSPIYDFSKHGVALQKPSSGLRQYRFIGWKDKGTGVFYGIDEELPIMTTVSKMYEAVFEQSYIVEWVVDGKSTLTTAWANQTPSFEPPTKEHDSYFSYNFIGWDKEIKPVSSDVAYIALFSKEYICGFGSSGGKITEVDGVITADCTSSSAIRYNIGNMLNIAAIQSKSIKIILPTLTLTMSSASVYSAYEQGVNAVVINVVSLASKNYKYSITTLDKSGSLISVSDVSATVSVLGDYDTSSSYLVATDSEGSVSDVRFTILSGYLNFTLKFGFYYNLIPQYGIGVIESEFVTVETSLERAEAGETIEITLQSVANGMYVSSVYVVDVNGNGVEVKDLRFTMPRSSVTVGVVCSYYEYTVTFKSEGKVLFTQKLKYGEQIVPPADPIKPSDTEYEYTFAGWDGELGVITKDEEFNALFTKSPIEKIEQQDSKLNKLIRAAYVVVPIVLALVVGIVVFLVIRKKRKSGKTK